MRLARWALIGVMAVGMVGLGCTDPYGGGGCTNAAAPNVNIANTAFCPGTRTITAGQTVTWTNLDGFSHTTTSDNGSLDPWNSGSVVSTYSRQFSTPGTYHYHCNVHVSMHGTIIVN